MPASPIHISDWTGLYSLNLADPNFYKPAQIDMLLGSDVLPFILKYGVQKMYREISLRKKLSLDG